jgi:hypothetical protein
VVIGVLWLLLALQRFNLLAPTTARYSWPALGGLALGGIASVAITFGFLRLVTLDGSNAPIPSARWAH